MQKIIKQDDGTLIVPFSGRDKETLFDGLREVKPTDSDYQKYLAEYEREQAIEAEIQAKLAEDKSEK